MYTDKVTSKSVFYLESPSTDSKPHDRRVTFWYHMKFQVDWPAEAPDGPHKRRLAGHADEKTGEQAGSAFQEGIYTGTRRKFISG